MPVTFSFIKSPGLALFWIVLTCSASHVFAQTSVRPNVILIFADDLGYGDLSCYGHPNIHTPRLDRMAQEGIRLTTFYTAAPVCTPSRAGLLTGRYPIRFGMPGNLGPDSPGGLPASELTLGEIFQQQGYKTACFGKWHLGSVTGHFPTEHGFDEYYGILYSNDMMPPWVQTDRELHLYRNTEPTEEYPVDQTTLTERYTAEAIRVIRETSDQPFFIYLPHAMPHLPISTSPAFADQSKGGKYGDVIETLDWSVGRLLDVLKEEGKAENTLVIFTSDNGPWNILPPRMYNTEPVEKWDAGTEGPFRGSKASTWEGGLRVPCIAYWPGMIEANQWTNEVTTTMDLYVTLAYLIGGQIPEDRALDGKNIWPILSRKGSSPHTFNYYFMVDRLEGVRDQTWKLFVKPEARGENPKTMLFHLGRDPYERFDVSADHPEVVKRLRAQLRAFADETNAKLWEE